MSTSGMYLSVTAIVDDDTEITGPTAGVPALHFNGTAMGGTLTVQVSTGADAPAVADRLLAAVQQWRDAIHEQAAADSATAPETRPDRWQVVDFATIEPADR